MARNFRRARRRPRRNVRRKVPTTVKRYVRRTLDNQIEDKYNYRTEANFNIPATGIFWCMNQLIKGTDRQTRLGNAIRCKHLRLGISAVNAAFAALGTAYVRVLVVFDKQANGAAPTIANFFVGPGAVPTITPLNPIQVPSRFQVLLDRRISLGGGYSVPYDHNRVYNFKLKQRTQYNDGNAGTVADISKNSLYVCFFSDLGATVPIATLNAIFVFEDA